MHTNFYFENLKGRDHLRDLGIDWIISKYVIKKWVMRLWTRFMWLRIGMNGGVL
jgi:hypothetical protein